MKTGTLQVHVTLLTYLSFLVCALPEPAHHTINLDILVDEDSTPKIASGVKQSGNEQPLLESSDQPPILAGLTPAQDIFLVATREPERVCKGANGQCYVSGDCCSNACYFGGDKPNYCGAVREGRHCTKRDDCYREGGYDCYYDETAGCGICKLSSDNPGVLRCFALAYACFADKDCCSGRCGPDQARNGNQLCSR